MYKAEIVTKDGQEITIMYIDSWYLGDDKLYRFFNDLEDFEISMTAKLHEVEIDGDTIFVPLNIIRKITMELIR